MSRSLRRTPAAPRPGLDELADGLARAEVAVLENRMLAVGLTVHLSSLEQRVFELAQERLRADPPVEH